MQHRKLCRLNAFSGAECKQPNWRQLPEDLLAIITSHVETLRDRFSWLGALSLTSPILRTALRSNRWIYGPPDVRTFEQLVTANQRTSRGRALGTVFRGGVSGVLKGYQSIFRVALAYWLLKLPLPLDKTFIIFEYSVVFFSYCSQCV